MGEGGSVDDGTVSEVAEGMRSLLAAIDARQMSCSAATVTASRVLSWRWRAWSGVI